MPSVEKLVQHSGFQVRTTIKTVGAGLPAKAVCQSMNRVTDPAPSRASPRPHFWRVFQGWNRVVPSVEMCAQHRESQAERRSKLWERACIPRLEPGCAVGGNVGLAPRIPSPNSDQTVGAGLLAKAVCQSMNRVTDPAPSRASSLPHLGCIPMFKPCPLLPSVLHGPLRESRWPAAPLPTRRQSRCRPPPGPPRP